MRRPGVPYVDTGGVIAWIVEHADLPADVVRPVLAMEFEYMLAVGIIAPCSPSSVHEFQYYDPSELAGERPGFVDTYRIAEDAHRLLGVSVTDADLVFATEIQYLEMRGLA